MPLRFETEKEPKKLKLITIPPLSDDLYKYFKTIKDSQPKVINEKLISILKISPDSDILAVRTKLSSFATWKTKQLLSQSNITDWKDMFGLLRHAPHHKIYWAVVAAKMISIVRHVQRNDTVVTDYSVQYLLDSSADRTVHGGLSYALENKIPREDTYKPRGYVPLFSVKGDIVKPQTLRAALGFLKFTPVAAKLHVFTPDLELSKNGIYRGPRHWLSKYCGRQNVMIYGMKIVKEELVAFVNLPRSEVSSFNVSLDTMLVQALKEDEDGTDYKQLAAPTYLLTDFCVLVPP